MVRRAYLTVLALGASALIVTACETAPIVEPTVDAVVEEVAPAPVELSEFDRAMQTVDELVASGNTQTAIDRTTQLLRSPDITDDERAQALLRRGDLQYSDEGYNVWGAVEDMMKVADVYPDTQAAAEATAMLGVAREEAKLLSELVLRPETSRTQRFESLLRLGRHDEALDLMLTSNLTPKNEELIAMFQIGYLCVGDDQTGPVYNAVEANGSPLELRFCDFGK